MNKILELLKKLDKYNLKNEEKIFLGTDGSITNLLEILFDGEVVVETISQTTINNTYYRTVLLKINNNPLIYANSKISLKTIKDINLRDTISKDLLLADIPIGKILKSHNLETRREIKSIEYNKLSEKIKLHLKTKNNYLPNRTYHIIYKNKVLMEITEIFNIKEYL